MLSHPFRRELSATLRLAGPLILAQLAQIATSFVDTLMIGRWLGPEALAAGVLGSTVFFTTTVVGIGFVIAVGPTVAQAFVLDTSRLGPVSLAEAGLDASDTSASDHLPVVVDLVPMSR